MHNATTAVLLSSLWNLQRISSKDSRRSFYRAHTKYGEGNVFIVPVLLFTVQSPLCYRDYGCARYVIEIRIAFLFLISIAYLIFRYCQLTCLLLVYRPLILSPPSHSKLINSLIWRSDIIIYRHLHLTFGEIESLGGGDIPCIAVRGGYIRMRDVFWFQAIRSFNVNKVMEIIRSSNRSVRPPLTSFSKRITICQISTHLTAC